MSILVQKKKFEIHNYDARIISMKQHIRQDLSKNNSELILSYDKEMVKESLAKATRRKHLEVILIQTKMLGKDWKQANKGDIDELVYQVMQRYSDSGQETNCTADLNTCNTDLVTVQGNLDTCTSDLQNTNDSLTSCNADLATSQGQLNDLFVNNLCEPIAQSVPNVLICIGELVDKVEELEDLLAGGTTEICHKPGTPEEETLFASGKKLTFHLSHGDVLGPCV